MLHAISEQEKVNLTILLQGHLDAGQLHDAVHSLKAVEGVTSTHLLHRSKMVLLTAPKRSVPAISDLPSVLHIDLAHEAPLREVLDS
jgi:hypothetical protein